MNITEVRVKMLDDSSERLLAFCSVTIDDAFVIRDLKIIDGATGPFVAMPSRKLTDKCRKCGFKNHLRARFCNECGLRLNENRAPRDEDGRIKLHADVAHPINAESRDAIEEAVIEAYNREVDLVEDPNYTPKDDDIFDTDSAGIDVAASPQELRGRFDSFVDEVRDVAVRPGNARSLQSKSLDSSHREAPATVKHSTAVSKKIATEIPVETLPPQRTEPHTIESPSNSKPKTPHPGPSSQLSSTDGFAAGLF